MRLAVVLAVLLSSAGCGQGAEECAQWSSSGAGRRGRHAEWSGCGDGQLRTVHCDDAPDGEPIPCQCQVGPTRGHAFQITDPGELVTRPAAERVANSRCGWNVRE